MHVNDYSAYLASETFAIFLFHGVISDVEDSVRNYNKKHIKDKDFQATLEALLKKGGIPVSMDDILASHLASKPLPKKAFAVTFDDGFENNFSIAKPILEQFDIPATIYITTDFVENNSLSWIDRIEWAVSRTKKKTLKLPWGECKNIESPLNKIEALELIRQQVKNNPGRNPIRLAKGIQDQLGLTSIDCTGDQLNLKLTWKQVNQFASSKLITIGGHTHTHQILSHLSLSALDEEITTCIKLIEEKTNQPVRHFSYPEGLEHHYTPRCVEALKSAGIAMCPTAIHGINKIGDDPFCLKRIAVT